MNCSHSMYEWIRIDEYTRAKVCSMCGITLETKMAEKRRVRKKKKEE